MISPPSRHNTDCPTWLDVAGGGRTALNDDRDRIPRGAPRPPLWVSHVRRALVRCLSPPLLHESADGDPQLPLPDTGDLEPHLDLGLSSTKGRDSVTRADSQMTPSSPESSVYRCDQCRGGFLFVFVNLKPRQCTPAFMCGRGATNVVGGWAGV